MHEQLVKIWKNEKTCEWFFNSFNQWYENKEKKNKSVLLL